MRVPPEKSNVEEINVAGTPSTAFPQQSDCTLKAKWNRTMDNELYIQNRARKI
jgi:hypothetical protein